MKVGIIGSGTVGQTLGAGFASRGHEVMLGTRDPSQDKVQAWVKETGQGARAGTFADTAAFGDLVIVATLWEGTQSALQMAGPDRLAGKVVIDVTNPLDSSRGVPQLAVGHTDSGGEQVQRWIPEAKVVKAWNIITAGAMTNPKHEEGTPDMFIAGNDAEAKAKVTEILVDFGWPVIDMGGMEYARLLEPLALLWIHLYIKTQSGSHAFKLLRK